MVQAIVNETKNDISLETFLVYVSFIIHLKSWPLLINGLKKTREDETCIRSSEDRQLQAMPQSGGLAESLRSPFITDFLIQLDNCVVNQLDNSLYPCERSRSRVAEGSYPSIWNHAAASYSKNSGGTAPAARLSL